MGNVGHRERRMIRTSSALALVAALLHAVPLAAETPPLKLAAPFSATGPAAAGGVPALNAIRLGVDEANAAGDGPPILLDTYDDRSTDDGAREAARQIIAGDALVVVGPGTTTSGLAAGPVYGEAGLAAIVPYAHGAGGSTSPTTFRPVFSNADMGEALAQYLRQVLGAAQAVVIYRDNGYGRPIAAGFERVGTQLGLATVRRPFATPAEAADAARQTALDPAHPAIVLAMIDPDAAPVVTALARTRTRPLVLGTSAIATDAFAENFAREPETAADPGFFTDGIYAVSPLMLDSAGAEALGFAGRYRARFGREPRWEAAQGYDAARLAIAAMRAAATAAPDLAARRSAVRTWLAGRDSPAHAVASLTGPLWFDPERGRQQPTRIGRFHGTLFESAPVQLIPAANPSAAERAAGGLVALGDGRFATRQQVVATGIFVNEIPRIDIAQSTFTADFYLWLRFARGTAGADPTELDFPDLLRGSFDPRRPAAQGDLDDGTTYRLWRTRGDFKNDFDLHRYPLDRQVLAVRMFNARAASDRLVYVQDRRSIDPSLGALRTSAAPTESTGIAPAAFRNLTQWDPLRAEQLRDVLVTRSALGDPRLVGVERVRELSGYRVEIEVRRRTLATLAKTLLPLGIMALIMLASLWFPHGLVKEKITVAITGALSGAVLLASVNSQLGAVGYTMAVEYVFYVFFTLCLLCIVAVLAAEQLRVAGHARRAVTTEHLTRLIFAAAILATLAAAALATTRW